jgi:hypothetical protein
VNDDWRLRIDLHDSGHARGLTRALEEHERESGDSGSIHDRVIVSHDGGEVFCYTGTREQADDVRNTIEQIAAEHDWQPDFELMHWHPTADQWEDADKPLPETDAQRAAERRERMASEDADSAAEGYPEFEVRVQCNSRHEASELVHTLEQEGIPAMHRSNAVLVGANDEDSANQLAERLRGEAPPGCKVTVEGNLRAVYDGRPFWRQFAIFGGLGG